MRRPDGIWNAGPRRRRGKVTNASLTLVVLLATHVVGGECAQATEPRTGSYRPADVQIEASRIYVFVDKVGFGHQHGVEAKLVSGTLNLGAPQNAGRLVFDMKSFRADTPAARKYVGLSGTTDDATRRAVDANMRGSAVLDVARFPTATFQIDSASLAEESDAKRLPVFRLEGTFVLHGVNRPLVVLVEAQQARGWLHLRGNFRIEQTDYQITPYSKAFGAIGVSNSLRIYGDLFVAPNEHVVMKDIPYQE